MSARPIPTEHRELRHAFYQGTSIRMSDRGLRTSSSSRRRLRASESATATSWARVFRNGEPGGVTIPNSRCSSGMRVGWNRTISD